MLNKLKGGVAPFMMGMILAIGTVSTITAKQYQAENEKRREEYVNAKKRHIERLNKDMRGSFHKQNDHSTSSINATKSRESVYTNIFSNDAVEVKRRSRGSNGDKRAIINIDSNEYNKKRYSSSTNGNIRKRDLDISSGAIFDEQSTRQEQILKSYSNMQKLATKIYKDIASASSKVFTCDLPTGYKDAWNRDFNYTKIDDYKAQLSFNLPWNTSRIKILDIKLPILPDIGGSGSEVDIVKDIQGVNDRVMILTTKGDIWSAGYNNVKQRGNFKSGFTHGTWKKANISNIKSIHLFDDATLALDNDGQVWGVGNGAPLGGYSTQFNKWTKLPLTNVKEVKTYNARENVFAIKNDNSLWTGGSNGYGMTGHSGYGYEQVLTDVKDIFVTPFSVYVLKNDNTLWAAGRYAGYGLGEGSDGQQNTFVQHSSLPDIAYIATYSSNSSYSAVVDTAGNAWLAGYNKYKQMAPGPTTTPTYDYHKLTALPDGEIAKKYVLSRTYSMALSTTGNVYFVGQRNGLDGSGYIRVTQYSSTWKKVPVSGIVDMYEVVDFTDDFVFLEKADGTILGAGDQEFNLGLGGYDDIGNSIVSVYTEIPLTGIKEITRTSSHSTMVMLENGELHAVANNYTGMLGTGNTDDVNKWRKIEVDDIKSYYGLSNEVIFVVNKYGDVYAAGSNYKSKLGVSGGGNKTIFFKTIDASVLDPDAASGPAC
jgi:alpha-tubulin suppressor-like RCC1 family protein